MHRFSNPASATPLSRRATGLAAAAMLLLALAPGLPALELKGIQVPDKASIGGQALTLNGAGLRSKFFVKVYVGALYLGGATTNAERAITMPGPKRVALHMIYDDLSREKVTSAWMDGFKANLPEQELIRLRPRIDAFNALWPALKEGDLVQLDYSPGAGTVVVINATELGRIEGEDFNQAMLRIWLGESPADGDLKRGMLSQ